MKGNWKGISYIDIIFYRTTQGAIVGYRIKKCHDGKKIFELNKKTFPADVYDPKDFIHNWLLLTKEGEEAGFVSVRITGRLAVLTRVGVLSQHRGKKLQIKLMKHVIRQCKRMGLSAITTYVKNDNIASFKNILRSGFMPYRPKKPYAEKDIVYLIYRISD